MSTTSENRGPSAMAGPTIPSLPEKSFPEKGNDVIISLIDLTLTYY